MWLAGVYPLRLTFGFTIPAAWTILETNQFVWYVGYEGPEDWDSMERRYYESTARREMEPNPAQWIVRAEEYFVETVVPIGESA